jgi:hypothetical protein
VGHYDLSALPSLGAKEELVYALFPESARANKVGQLSDGNDPIFLKIGRTSPSMIRGQMERRAFLWPPPVQTCDPGEMCEGFPLAVPVELQMVQPTFSISVRFKAYDL